VWSAEGHATTYNYDTQGNRTAAVPGTGSATCDLWAMAPKESIWLLLGSYG